MDIDRLLLDLEAAASLVSAPGESTVEFNACRIINEQTTLKLKQLFMGRDFVLGVQASSNRPVVVPFRSRSEIVWQTLPGQAVPYRTNQKFHVWLATFGQLLMRLHLRNQRILDGRLQISKREWLLIVDEDDQVWQVGVAEILWISFGVQTA